MRLLTGALLAGVASCLLAAGAVAQTPKKGGELIFAVTAEPPNYDCHANTSFAFVHPVIPHYSTLLTFSGADYPKIVGDLAESWTVSDDGKTYTFKLFDGVKFHDGSSLTSADVKASYDRIINPPDGVVSARKATFSDVSSVEAPDAHTVVFHLSNPNASMLQYFASPFNCIYSAAKLKENPKYPETNIMGSGAFTFVEHVNGSSWTGKRFDGYFRKDRPYLDGYKAVFMKSGNVVNALRGNQIMAEFRGRTPAEAEQLMSAMGDKVTKSESPWIVSIIIVFNTQKKPFDDARVRRALSLAIDRYLGAQALQNISLLRHVGGLQRPGAEFALTPEELEKLPGFGHDIAKSREEAKRLLKEAGVENLSFKLTNRNVAEPYTPAGVFAIDQWRQIGVTVEHQQLETKLWQAALSSGNFDVAIDFSSEFLDDPSSQFAKYVTKDLSPIAYADHHNTELDKLYEQQMRATSPAKRKELTKQFEEIELTEAYSVPLLWWHRIIVNDAKLKGWNIPPSHYLDQSLVDVWLDQ